MKKRKLKINTDFKSDPESKRYPGKMHTKIVVDTSMYEEWLASLTEKERIEYWNKECKKGEANL